MIDKVRDNRLRRAAARRGFRIKGSGKRDPGGLDFGRYYVYPNDPRVTPEGHDPESPIFQGMIDEVELFLHPANMAKLLRRKT